MKGRWPLTARATAASVIAAIGATVPVALLVGPPIIVCWTGVGPAPEPATSQCVAAKMAALSPFMRLWIEAPGVAAPVFVAVAFVAFLAGFLAIAYAAKRSSAH